MSGGGELSIWRSDDRLARHSSLLQSLRSFAVTDGLGSGEWKVGRQGRLNVGIV